MLYNVNHHLHQARLDDWVHAMISWRVSSIQLNLSLSISSKRLSTSSLLGWRPSDHSRLLSSWQVVSPFRGCTFPNVIIPSNADAQPESLFVHHPPYQKAWMPPPVPPWIKSVNSCNECPPHSWKLGPSPQAVSHSILSYSRLGSQRPIQQHRSHSQAAAFPWSCNSCKFLDYEVCQRSNSCHIGWQQSTNTQLRRAGNRSLGTFCRRVSLDTLCWNETIAVHTYLLANYYGIFEVLTNLSVTT